jgi:hypothetical protein
MTKATLNLPERIAMSNPQLALGLMLLALHAAIAWGIEEWWARAFLLAHFGLFLLWQPVWRGEREIEPAQAFSVVAVACLLVGWLNWWLMAVWVAALVGMIGGSVPRLDDRRHRVISVLAALYLLSMLLVWVVPQLFAGQVVESGVEMLVRYALPLVPIAILLVRAPPRIAGNPVGIDLFYSVLLFLLVVALVLGSFVIRDLSHGNYVIALAQTLVGIAVVLMGLSWLWYPHSGFTGIGYLLSSYLMSLGLPFERWMQRLAALAQEESDPQRFVALGVQHMLVMPWVRGVEWKSPRGDGEVGARTAHATALESGELKLVIHTRWAVSPAILLHLKLLAQMIGHYFEAKQRAQIQRENAYTHAIYETGARLTHDVKNLLQSLKALCSAAANSTPQQAAALQALMQRQLPQITQRLNTTLEKLRAPHEAHASQTDAQPWWDALAQRCGARGVAAVLDGDISDLRLPAEVFDSVADNLVENAMHKAAHDGALGVSVSFCAVSGTLRVVDDGAPVPRAIAQQLFSAPVASQTGLGVGLYQASRLAKEAGYRLYLEENQQGRVAFALAPAGMQGESGGRHVA